jgi:hypothetical protein
MSGMGRISGRTPDPRGPDLAGRLRSTRLLSPGERLGKGSKRHPAGLYAQRPPEGSDTGILTRSPGLCSRRVTELLAKRCIAGHRTILPTNTFWRLS